MRDGWQKFEDLSGMNKYHVTSSSSATGVAPSASSTRGRSTERKILGNAAKRGSSSQDENREEMKLEIRPDQQKGRSSSRDRSVPQQKLDELKFERERDRRAGIRKRGGNLGRNTQSVDKVDFIVCGAWQGYGKRNPSREGRSASRERVV